MTVNTNSHTSQVSISSAHKVRIITSCLVEIVQPPIVGGEGGGHTGETAFSILIPACVDAVKGKKSPLTGEPVMVIAAGTLLLYILSILD